MKLVCYNNCKIVLHKNLNASGAGRQVDLAFKCASQAIPCKIQNQIYDSILLVVSTQKKHPGIAWTLFQSEHRPPGTLPLRKLI